MFLPYVLDDEELTAFFHAVDSYECKNDPFCPILLSIYFRLTYTCGLRPAESRLLKRNEVDLNSGEIHIANSKYHNIGFRPSMKPPPQLRPAGVLYIQTLSCV